MNLGGLQKSSLIDYPGKLSCVIFLSGCNFECPYCHNPSLVRGGNECRDSLTVEDIYGFLKSRRHLLDGVVISGGEPTLQKDLVSLCESIKLMGYSIKLDTNGSRPNELKRLIESGLVDYIAMDIKTDPFHYDSLARAACNPEDIISSIIAIMESASDYEFRTTCVKGFVDESIIEKIAALIKDSRLYALQRFNRSELLHPEFFHNAECGYGEEDMVNFKRIAEPWVRNCIVR
ncbi:MAG: anaerobic ribonucleoside-triphosphate reductase activating protein [Deltaproteobacteria bacterium RBG_19FT_COMBO_46_9]|jgi:pyruvate formate lyase activating enzyme|nr:MAG: anaerobic ribonucleoside-triphosphate reductase activating protein [Deltaproteobacteria bacterium RBG_19FT_COMBO_46_9]